MNLLSGNPFCKIIYLLTFGIFIVTVTSALSHLHLLFELSSHFKYQYMLVSALLVIILLFLRRYKMALIALVLFSIHAFHIIPYYLPNPILIDNSSQSSLKLLHANVLISNNEYQPFIELVNRESPDIIVVQEFGHQWSKSLYVIHEQYPHRVLHPKDSPFGIGVYSRYSFESADVKAWGSAELPSIIIAMSINNKKFNLITTHPFPPISANTYLARNNQLEEIANVVNSLQNPTIVVGDLNTTMWSHTYKQFEKKSGLINARKGFGLLPSWPANLFLMGIPIDHVLISKEFSVAHIQTTPTNGSDHLAIIAELVF